MNKKIVPILLGGVFVYVIWLKITIFTSPDLVYVQQVEWQYENGFKITEGDFLSFEKNDISNDTIYVNQLPIAKIKRTYQSHKIMIIESLSTKKTGMYREIGAHLEDKSTGIYNHLILILLHIIY